MYSSHIIWAAFFAFCLLAGMKSNAANEDFVCPKWLLEKNNKLPDCDSKSGTALVAESNPVAALVVSDGGASGTKSGFTVDVVLKTLQAAGEKNPLIILPVEKQTLDRIRDAIDALNVDNQTKKKWKSSLLYVDGGSYTWQQDYMQAYVDSKTGKIVVRKVDGYFEGMLRFGEKADFQNSFEKSMSLAAKCGITVGPPLTTAKGDKIENGSMGGNIETLPGGICLLGDDHFREGQWGRYSKDACGATTDVIKVPTSWLNVGHTDEVIKVVRDNTKAAPCNFAVTVASPDKAMELLQKNPGELFMDFSGMRDKVKKGGRRLTAELEQLCEIVRNIRKPTSPLKNDKNNRVKAVSQIENFQKIFLPFANAGAAVTSTDEIDDFNCESIKNSEAYSAMTTDHEAKIYNQLVQKNMNKLKTEVGNKLKSKFPQCQIQIIDMPDLFLGGDPVENEQAPGRAKTYDLPNKMGNSFLPNPTNAISVNDTVINSDPTNAAFKKYMSEQYQKLGLKSDYVDTFSYAHVGMGNLHCSTNTIHLCKPVGVK